MIEIRRSCVAILLAAALLAISIPSSSAKEGEGNETEVEDHCESSIFPCSDKIGGNLVLIVFYGMVLACAAKLISDGAELLLDLGLPAAIIGGVVLPILGAVPDSAMIFVSGMGDDAQNELAVGMGTLAGSTILLLTVAWGFSLWVGRCDLEETSEGTVSIDKQCTGISWTKQGSEIASGVFMTAVVMLVTAIPYFVIQSAEFKFGARDLVDKQPPYVKWCAFITMCLSFSGFVAYIALSVIDASRGKNAKVLAHELRRKQDMVAHAAHAFLMHSIKKKHGLEGIIQARARPVEDTEEGGSHGQTRSSDQARLIGKKFGNKWGMKAQARKLESADFTNQRTRVKEEPEVPEEVEDDDEEVEVEEPQWKIAVKAFAQLLAGVGLVTVFSDPMCGSLAALTDSSYPQYLPIPTFYVSFIVTPLCSNASELFSSILFAMKKQKENIALTYSQLYGAAVMNNTLCLGVFCALVFFRDLNWTFSAEVTVILLCELLVGLVATLSRKLYRLYLAIPIMAIYPLSLLIVALLENIVHWG